MSRHTPLVRKPIPGSILNWGHPLASGMHICWPFLEGAGLSRTKDYGGNGIDITSFGPATWGHQGRTAAATFYNPTQSSNLNATTAAYNLTTTSVNRILTTSGMTLLCRWNPLQAAPGGTGGVFGLGNTASGGAAGWWGMRCTLTTFFRMSSNSNTITAPTVPTIAANSWHDFAITVGTDNKTCNFYIDGVSYGSAVGGSANIIASVSTGYMLFNYYAGFNNSQDWNSAFEYIYIYNYPMSQSMIQEIATNPWQIFLKERKRSLAAMAIHGFEPRIRQVPMSVTPSSLIVPSREVALPKVKALAVDAVDNSQRKSPLWFPTPPPPPPTEYFGAPPPTVSIVQSTTLVIGAGQSPHTISLLNPPTAGNGLILIGSTNWFTATITGVSSTGGSWSEFEHQDNSGLDVSAWIANPLSAGASQNVTVAWNGSDSLVVCLLEVSPCVLDQHNGTSSAAGFTLSNASITTMLSPTELIISSVITASQQPTIQLPATTIDGVTLGSRGNYGDFDQQYVVSLGTYSSSWTVPIADTAAALIFSLAPATPTVIVEDADVPRAKLFLPSLVTPSPRETLWVPARAAIVTDLRPQPMFHGSLRIPLPDQPSVVTVSRVFEDGRRHGPALFGVSSSQPRGQEQSSPVRLTADDSRRVWNAVWSSIGRLSDIERSSTTQLVTVDDVRRSWNAVWSAIGRLSGIERSSTTHLVTADDVRRAWNAVWSAIGRLSGIERSSTTQLVTVDDVRRAWSASWSILGRLSTDVSTQVTSLADLTVPQRSMTQWAMPQRRQSDEGRLGSTFTAVSMDVPGVRPWLASTVAQRGSQEILVPAVTVSVDPEGRIQRVSAVQGHMAIVPRNGTLIYVTPVPLHQAVDDILRRMPPVWNFLSQNLPADGSFLVFIPAVPLPVVVIVVMEGGTAAALLLEAGSTPILLAEAGLQPGPVQEQGSTPNAENESGAQAGPQNEGGKGV